MPLTQKEKQEALELIKGFQGQSAGQPSGRHAERMKRLRSITESAKKTSIRKPERGLLERLSGVAEKGLSTAAELTIAPLFRAGARPFVSLARGIQGKEDPVNLPFGEVKPYSAVSTGEAVGEGISVATAALPVEKVLVAPLKGTASWLYQSALKIPKSSLNKMIKFGESTAQASKRVAKTGLDEVVWLTEGGVERTASKIDELELSLGEIISQAESAGKKISLNGIKGYIDEVKNVFKNSFDTKFAEKATKEIDEIYSNFVQKYGKEISIKQAQKIKVSTYKALKNAYGELTGASKEAQKAGVRFLKEKIVEGAPASGGVNKRLAALYDLDKALDSFSSRTKKLNLLGLGAKFGGAAGGFKGAAVGKGLDLIDAPAVKSGAAILLNLLAGGGATAIKGSKIPVANAINHLISLLTKDKQQQK